MLLANQQKTNNNNKPIAQCDKWIAQLLSDKQYVEAYQLLKTEPQQKLSTLFNMALCMYFAKEYEQTLTKLDEALAKLQCPPDKQPLLYDDLYKKLEAIQNTSNSYLLGISDDYARNFQYLLKNNILRIKVDCYRALCLWNKVIELAALLKSHNYQNVESAVAEAISMDF